MQRDNGVSKGLARNSTTSYQKLAFVGNRYRYSVIPEAMRHLSKLSKRGWCIRHKLILRGNVELMVRYAASGLVMRDFRNRTPSPSITAARFVPQQPQTACQCQTPQTRRRRSCKPRSDPSILATQERPQKVR